MSDHAGAIRDLSRMLTAKSDVRISLQALPSSVGVRSSDLLYKAYQLRDILIVQEAVLTAMIDFAQNADGTRGSALYCDKNGELRDGLEEIFRFRPSIGHATNGKIQVISRLNGQMQPSWRDVRPLPVCDDVFETVWKRYREDKCIY